VVAIFNKNLSIAHLRARGRAKMGPLFNVNASFFSISEDQPAAPGRPRQAVLSPLL
jgi:hypothetical protein